MDASFQMAKTKRLKLGGEGTEGGSKSLSNLPDDLLVGKILSLLPTKDAIRTSVLSKRWEYLWTSIPCLNFHAGWWDERPPLVNIVDRALTLRVSADIKKFCLTFPVLDDACRVNSWVSALVRRDVEDLSIYLHGLKEPFPLPRSLFQSATLKELELDFNCIFKVPSTVCFSSLTSLTLLQVVFADDYSAQQLFSGCPVLEELSLEQCNWTNIKFVSIYAPNLLRFTIDEGDSNISEGSNGPDYDIWS